MKSAFTLHFGKNPQFCSSTFREKKNSVLYTLWCLGHQQRYIIHLAFFVNENSIPFWSFSIFTTSSGSQLGSSHTRGSQRCEHKPYSLQLGFHRHCTGLVTVRALFVLPSAQKHHLFKSSLPRTFVCPDCFPKVSFLSSWDAFPLASFLGLTRLSVLTTKHMTKNSLMIRHSHLYVEMTFWQWVVGYEWLRKGCNVGQRTEQKFPLSVISESRRVCRESVFRRPVP